MNSNIVRIHHKSVPTYLATIRQKVIEFGKEALIAYSEPKALVIGFQCKNEVHVVGNNSIRSHYNIERILPNIPGLVSFRRNKSPTVSHNDGVEMFINDCKKALNNE